MPNWGYSIIGLDPSKTAIASGRDLRISFKAAREICNQIKGMKLDDARTYLEQVVALKTPVPFKRYKKKVAHRRGLNKWFAGRYPVKAAQKIIKILDSVEANAQNKGLDVEKLVIIHAAAQKGPKLKRYIPRAFGRSSPKFEQLTHVEIAVEERD